MKSKLILLSIAFASLCSCKQKDFKKSYQLITSERDSLSVNNIDTNTVNALDDKLRSIAAYYSAKFGTGGDLNNDALTIALKLDSQGSAKHKEFVKRYLSFPEIDTLLNQNFFIPPSAANRTNFITSLRLTSIGDTVKSNYTFDVVDHMETTSFKREDIFIFNGEKFKKLQ